MLTVGLFPNIKKKSIKDVVESIVSYCDQHGIQVALPEQAAVSLGYADRVLYVDSVKGSLDTAISLGGDGTLLSTARRIASAGIPIFGVNMGKLGFLTEVELTWLGEALDRIVHEDYSIEERIMLDAVIMRRENRVFVSSALNDIVVTKAGYSRMIKLALNVNDHLVANYLADGLIIATPTGSTGYSLSAGGPIVQSGLNVILITPICSHSLQSRSLIVSEKENISVQALSTLEDIVLTIDGQIVEKLAPEDCVMIQKSPFNAKFIKFGDINYYKRLRKKLLRDDSDANF